ncbi:class I SAM-dependent methyltransferase [Engelhardtia mirabilis]|uniref:class I SAM-dependent methyltransferase n=1 Tax=Engelhardtia mirabilis TaxID=2528011 RepID=UPI003AF37073
MTTNTVEYWDRVAESSRFSHPLDASALSAAVPRSARLVDLGCGYGRLLGELIDLGYRDVVGVDQSAAMLDRARAQHPAAQLIEAPLDRLPLADSSVDGVLLYAVLTCIPADDLQLAVMAEIERVLVPGGHLFLSDLPLQTDRRNRARYRRDADHCGQFGVFDSGDGTRFRHHEESWLDRLTANFEGRGSRSVHTRTMRGNPILVVQRHLRLVP